MEGAPAVLLLDADRHAAGRGRQRGGHGDVEVDQRRVRRSGSRCTARTGRSRRPARRWRSRARRSGWSSRRSRRPTAPFGLVRLAGVADLDHGLGSGRDRRGRGDGQAAFRIGPGRGGQGLAVDDQGADREVLVEVQDDAGQGALGRQGQGGVALDRLALRESPSASDRHARGSPPLPRRAPGRRCPASGPWSAPAWAGRLAGVAAWAALGQRQKRNGAQGRGPDGRNWIGKAKLPSRRDFSGDMGKLGHARRQAGSFRGGSSTRFSERWSDLLADLDRGAAAGADHRRQQRIGRRLQRAFADGDVLVVQLVVAELAEFGGQRRGREPPARRSGRRSAARSRSRPPRCRRGRPCRPAGRCRRPGRSAAARQTGDIRVGRTCRSPSSSLKPGQVDLLRGPPSPAAGSAIALTTGGLGASPPAGRDRCGRPPARRPGRPAGSRPAAPCWRRRRGGEGRAVHHQAAFARSAAKHEAIARPSEITAFQPAIDRPRKIQTALSQDGAAILAPFSRATRSSAEAAPPAAQAAGPGHHFHSAPA